jgi:hypothetical protein
MENRRNFIKKSAMLCAALSLPLPAQARAVQRELKTRNPKRALVLCYSQSGFTSRYGRLMACILKDRGLTVDLADMRSFDKKRLADYDLILIGSPVFYYDIPSNVSDWLAAMPKITGTPVAAFVSFGGPEGNQHNALCHMPFAVSRPIPRRTGTAPTSDRANICPMRPLTIRCGTSPGRFWRESSKANRFPTPPKSRSGKWRGCCLWSGSTRKRSANTRLTDLNAFCAGPA